MFTICDNLVVAEKDGVVTVKYDSRPGGGRGAGPGGPKALVLGIAKGAYKAVQFVDRGKVVGEVKATE
jgi:hypothetical protein